MLRLLLPQKDRERAIYGLKEKNIAKTYIKLIPLGPKDPDALRLLDWKKPSGPNVGYPLGGFDLSVDSFRGLLGTFLLCCMMSLGGALQLLKGALPSMISTPPLMKSPEIFPKGKQRFGVFFIAPVISLGYLEMHNLKSCSEYITALLLKSRGGSSVSF